MLTDQHAFSDQSDVGAQALQWHRAPSTRNADRAVSNLMEQYEAAQERARALRKTDRERLAATLSAFALELYAGHCANRGRWQRYSRAKSDYDKRDRYHQSPVTHTTVCKVAEWLMAAGYANGQLGHYRRYEAFGKGVGAGRQSRIGATRKLVELFENTFDMTAQDVGFAPWLETVILRGAPKERGGVKLDIEYLDTPDTCVMRTHLRRINEGLSGYRISSVGEDGVTGDLPPFRLRRIFSRGSFGLGGRFYGGPWMDMPSDDRTNLLIDGEEVVELDFSSFHARLIYQLEGKPLSPEVDPYAIPSWEGAERRGWVKTAFQQLINGGADDTLRKPADIPSGELGKGGWQKLLQDIAHHHASIRHWFRSGRGLELQRIDSDVAEAVMLELLAQSICCLPIHDSFIVPRSHAQQLNQAMVKSYRMVMTDRGCVSSDPIIHSQKPADLL